MAPWIASLAPEEAPLFGPSTVVELETRDLTEELPEDDDADDAADLTLPVPVTAVTAVLAAAAEVRVIVWDFLFETPGTKG